MRGPRPPPLHSWGCEVEGNQGHPSLSQTWPVVKTHGPYCPYTRKQRGDLYEGPHDEPGWVGGPYVLTKEGPLLEKLERRGEGVVAVWDAVQVDDCVCDYILMSVIIF